MTCYNSGTSDLSDDLRTGVDYRKSFYDKAQIFFRVFFALIVIFSHAKDYKTFTNFP